jgi:RNA polymerase sigma factor (sigma-70 family)
VIAATDVRSYAAEGFEDVYEQCWTPMVRLAALTTGSVSVAEEIVQDAFVQLYRHRHRIRYLRAWVRKAVINGCRDWIRRRARHPDTDDGDGFVTHDDERAIVVRDALRLLTPRQRAAVVLRFYADLPEREIAELLGCRPGTVKSTLAQSLAKLAKELQP